MKLRLALNPASTSQGLGLQICHTMPGSGLLFLPLLEEDTDLLGEYSTMSYSYTRGPGLTSCQAGS